MAFDPETAIDWDRYFLEQVGQSGHGNFFQGQLYQRGSGIGNIFRGIFKLLLPVAKRVGRTVGKQALSTGSRIAGDLIEGVPLNSAIKTHGATGIRAVGQKLGSQMLARHTPKRRKATTSKKTKVQKGRGLGSRKRKKTGGRKSVTLGVLKKNKKKQTFFN